MTKNKVVVSWSINEIKESILMAIFFNLIYILILCSSLELPLQASGSLIGHDGIEGDKEVNERKVTGLATGTNGYEKNPEAARNFNDTLVARGDQDASRRKFFGLLQGGSIRLEERSIYGFLRDWPPVARERIADYYPTYGYERNSEAAREFNDTLVERDDKQAIQRKLDGLIRGGDIPPFPEEWRNALRGEPGSCYSPLGEYCHRYWHPYPTYGYKKNPEAAEEFKLFITIKPTLLGLLNIHVYPESLSKVILRYMC